MGTSPQRAAVTSSLAGRAPSVHWPRKDPNQMADDSSLDQLHWYTPEALLELAVARSRVVMVNEAHNDMLRCLRTREVGRRLLPVAHRLGVRHLAMEALWNGGLRHLTEQANTTRQLPAVPHGGYLAQPEMRALVQEALDLGWTLLAYEMDFDREPAELAQRPPGDRELIAWREQEEAQNLAAHLQALPTGARLLVWCGWSHLAKVPVRSIPWMACRFIELSGVEPYCIDQTVTVATDPALPPFREFLVREAPRLEALGGTAGLLSKEVARIPGMAELADRADAFVYSLHNVLE